MSKIHKSTKQTILAKCENSVMCSDKM